ncbi:MAG: SDR family oxidoreductase [Chloroflexota bacterium]
MSRNLISEWYDFSGKTAVVTGGTGVLGSEMACALVDHGADVAILARKAKFSDSAKQRLENGKGQYVVVEADVLKRETLALALGKVIEAFGRNTVDVLINCAGGNHPQATTNPANTFFDLPQEALQFVFDLNIVGSILPSQIFGRVMAEQGYGSILNVSSMASFKPLTRVVGYSAAKAGINNFTQWLAVHMAHEYSPSIRVNALAPGFFIGNQNRALLLDEKDELTERGQLIIDHTPMGRFGKPDELIGTMLWLLSPASQFVTGITVPVDGGFSAFSGV